MSNSPCRYVTRRENRSRKILRITFRTILMEASFATPGFAHLLMEASFRHLTGLGDKGTRIMASLFTDLAGLCAAMMVAMTDWVSTVHCLR